MSELRDSFLKFYDTTVVANVPHFSVALLEAVIIALAMMIAGRRAQAGWRASKLTQRNANLAILLGRLSYLAALVIGIIWIAQIFGVQLTGLLAFLGALSLAITFAIQDVLKNLVAGLYLLWEQPFLIGDLISVKDFSGSVEDIRVRTTLLRTDSGQMIVVPNAVLFTEIVINRRLEVRSPESQAPASPQA